MKWTIKNFDCAISARANALAYDHKRFQFINYLRQKTFYFVDKVCSSLVFIAEHLQPIPAALKCKQNKSIHLLMPIQVHRLSLIFRLSEHISVS